ncbi:MAG: 1-acyl-sn-glycerol-3-phosphate acyltransferase [Rhodospirillaceae bacterium]|nr:1-acyl-sn-glycerol-3-phosphate acyltransferase [Rhodospirillaceae bacterium]
MIVIRSWIYLAAFLTWTLGLAVICLPSLSKSSWTLAAIRMWIRGVMVLARTIVGIDCRVLGKENLPSRSDGRVGACIIAAQHQSSFETYRLFMDLPHPIFILKRELIWIPFIGWYMTRAGLISIDRGAGATAMRKMLRAAQAALDNGHQVVVFPEGTRVLPGETRPYRPGIAALYAHCTAPVIPMALNSGYFWGKTRVLKLPGEIVFQFLPALPPGLDKDGVLAALRTRLDAAAGTLPKL